MPHFHSVLMEKKVAIMEAKMKTGLTFSALTRQHRAEEDVDLMISTAKAYYREFQRRADKDAEMEKDIKEAKDIEEEKDSEEGEDIEEAKDSEEEKDIEKEKGIKTGKSINLGLTGLTYVKADHLKKAAKINKQDRAFTGIRRATRRDEKLRAVERANDNVFYPDADEKLIFAGDQIPHVETDEEYFSYDAEAAGEKEHEFDLR